MRSLTFPRTISIHALREEGDAPPSFFGYDGGYFYPRPPRGGRPSINLQAKSYAAISIHALREEGDLLAIHIHCVITISIHALREEGDPDGTKRLHLLGNFYPRPPRGGRPRHGSRRRSGAHISIHALREEGDAAQLQSCRSSHGFLSTPSARRATKRASATSSWRAYFYPRPPRGGRPRAQLTKEFKEYISIHALREEGDRCRWVPSAPDGNFYPRPPRGGRQYVWILKCGRI